MPVIIVLPYSGALASDLLNCRCNYPKLKNSNQNVAILKKAQKTQSKTHWSAYRKYRYLVNKNLKSQYYENLIKENKNNPSGPWKTLNELTSRNIKSSAPSSIITVGVEYKNTKSMSSLFNNFFTSIGITLANAIKQKCRQSQSPGNPPPGVNSTFKFQEIQITSLSRIYQN